MFIWQQDFSMIKIVSYYLFLFSTLCFSQVVGTPYIIQAENNTSFVLDNISKSPTVAYSVRKLSKTYHGFCLRVRRGSDNALLDIGFDANGDLDTTSMISFVGNSNGFVAVWYDQSGNQNNLKQVTQIYQPKIINSGVLITSNGKPFVGFYGTPSSTNYNHMDVSGGQVATNAQLFIVNKFGSAAGSDGFLLGHTSYFNYHSMPSTNLFHSQYANSSVYSGILFINGVSFSPSLAPFHSDLKVISLQPLNPTSGAEWNVIGRDRGSHLTNNGGGYSEIYSFASAITTTERQFIENNIIYYYSL
ncbi:MAG: hypothetical protein RLZZ529_53 [Bacteroidota bacterium]|jgi:hypothetical protein